MGKFEKIIEKLLDHNSVMKFQDLEYFLLRSGYVEKQTGKTSGSRKAYINLKTKHIIRLHKPHPGNEIKRYVKDFLVAEFQKFKLI